jgi:hypothetical protein
VDVSLYAILRDDYLRQKGLKPRMRTY